MRHTLKLAETRDRGPRRQPPNTALLLTKKRSSDNNPKESQTQGNGSKAQTRVRYEAVTLPVTVVNAQQSQI
ncbi:hypothetical protein YC2023_007639 [Brassica napus]